MFHLNFFLVALSSSISIAGCVFMISIYHRYPQIARLDGSKHIYILQTLDLCLALVTLIPTPIFPNKTLMCDIQGFAIQVFTVSGVLWTGFMSFEFYRRFYMNGGCKCISIHVALVMCLGLGLVFGSLPLLLAEYSSSGEWCTMKVSEESSSGNKVLKFSIYLLMWIASAWNIFMYVIVIKKYNEIEFERPSELFLVTRLKLYPLIIFLCFLPITVARIMEISGKSDEIYVLTTRILLRLMGFFNALVYGYSPEIKNILSRKNSRQVLL